MKEKFSITFLKFRAMLLTAYVLSVCSFLSSCTKDKISGDTAFIRDTIKVSSSIASLSSYSSTPLISNDKPWESARINYSSVAKVGNNWFLWYEAFELGSKNDFSSRLCVATSKDGLHWEKPSLDLVKYKGSTSNILIDSKDLGDFHAPYVFYDKKAPDSTKFKVIFVKDKYTIYGAVSSDGIHFGEIRQLSWGGGFDSQNVCVPTANGYKYFLRAVVNGRRRIATMNSKSFTPLTIGKTDLLSIKPIPSLGEESLEYYTPAISSIYRGTDSLWVGFPSAYFDREGVMQPHLIASNDGQTFTDYGFLDVSNSELAPNITMVCMNPIKIDDKNYWLYYVYINNRHGKVVNKGSGVYRVKIHLNL